MTTSRKSGRHTLNKKFFGALFKLIAPFFRSEEKWRAWGYLLTLLALLCCVSAVNVLISYVGRDFITYLTAKKEGDFYSTLPKYFGAFAVATIIAVSYRYIEETLALKWRNWMTGHLLKKYFFARAYYNLRSHSEIDNPDQRITEDLRSFTATTLSLFLIFLNSTITVIAFIGVLYSISNTLVLALVVYTSVGTIGTIFIGRRLVRIYNRQFQREATFRYGLVRVRDNAESIAFFRGEPRERLDLLRRFKAVFRNTTYLIGWNRNLGFFTTGYNYLALLVPTLLVAPLYFQGKIEFGVVTQAGGAFAQVLAALSVIITQFERVSAYGAGVFRLESLWNILNARELNENDDDPELSIEEGKRLAVKSLTVKPPNTDRVLVEDLNFKLQSGSSILIMGASGTGKSSILRTIAGLWKSGSGAIQRPRLKDMIFLPQRPYMVTGSLRAQLMYPARETNGDEELLKEILAKVNLGEVLERVNGNLGSQLDWQNILSLGEQQRISFARVLYHKPRLAFLDEATSALDEENEASSITLLEKQRFPL